MAYMYGCMYMYLFKLMEIFWVIYFTYSIDLRRCHTRQFFLATCNANLGEKDIPGSCRIVDICKLLYDLQSDYFANSKCYRGRFLL